MARSLEEAKQLKQLTAAMMALNSAPNLLGAARILAERVGEILRAAGVHVRLDFDGIPVEGAFETGDDSAGGPVIETDLSGRGLRVIGRMRVRFRDGREVSADERDLLFLLAHFASASLETTRLNDETLAAKTSLEKSRRELAFHLKQYQSFISQSSEGVWRFETARPIALGDLSDASTDSLLTELFEHAFLAECNDSMARMYGFEKAEELTGKPLRELMIPEDPRNIEYLKAFARSGFRLENAESVERDRHGNLRHFSNNLVAIIEDGYLTGAWGTQRDITDQKNAREALEASEKKFRRIFDSNIVGIFFWRPQGEISLANSEFLRLIGLTRDEFTQKGLGWRDLTEEGTLPAQPGTIVEKEFLRRDGGRIPVMVGGAELDPETQTGVAFAIDISDQKRAEKASREMAEQARLANQAKSRFLANMSHEIRTPLGVILGFTDLAMDADDPSEVREYLTAIRRNGQLLSQIIGDVLDFSKIEASRIELENKKISLPRFLSEVESLLAMKAQQKGLVFQIQPHGELPESILTDPVRLHQVLVNLIGNSIKFTARGSVTLSVQSGEKLEEGRDLRLEFLVRDTGIGIPPEFHQELFQPFMQVDNSLTRQFGGTGLGLLLAKQLARALGGDLRLLESYPGSGTVFSVTINGGAFDGARWVHSTRPSPRPEKPSALESGPDLSDRRILIVEDSKDNQILVEHYLRGTRARLAFAANGREALDLAHASGFDLVLMDLQMPVMDGYEAMKRLRDEGYTRPIVALTAHALREEKEKAMRSGFTDYLTKPLSRGTLFETITKHLKQGLQ